ncbi:IclR family transcriptional regulator domain-containing protein [Albibacillus kandeliae]|uniref:IclR family transcriptional regulator domain-containing protein n=1 Tax=Albibacillus kandeliae TaxID=2174228 RepID=UPI000D69B882|nr:IclR family transcriptional regulator C-terminal domain-containing protein [Albibacillus kandeliae]
MSQDESALKSVSLTVMKGMAVLAAFDGRTHSMTLAELARATGQDRATARRGALTLVQLGYLQQNGRGFSLTPKVLLIAGGFLQANRFGLHVQPVLNGHAETLGTEITLALREGSDVLLLAQSTLHHGRPVSFGFTVGSRLPLLHTSLGRMLLACEADEALPDLISAAPPPRYTDLSLASPAEITESIRQARADGYAMTDGEFEAGIVGFAVPVSRPGHRGLVVGANVARGAGGTDKDRMLQTLQLCAADLRRNEALEAL